MSEFLANPIDQFDEPAQRRVGHGAARVEEVDGECLHIVGNWNDGYAGGCSEAACDALGHGRREIRACNRERHRDDVSEGDGCAPFTSSRFDWRC